MSQNRRDILSNLATLLGAVTGVTTVVRSLREIDITQYNEAQLPLVNLIEPDEDSAGEMTSMRSLMGLNPMVSVFFIRWGEDPDSTYENLEKNIRDQIGDNFTINGTCSGAWVTSVSPVTGEMPLFRFDIEISCEYYANLKNI